MTDPLVQVLRDLDSRLAGVEEKLALLVEQNGRPRRRWLPLREAAVELGISYDAARMRAKRRQLKTQRQGERIYVDLDHSFGGGD